MTVRKRRSRPCCAPLTTRISSGGRAVAQAAGARGVAVSPGADFDPLRHDLSRVRLSVSRVERRDIEPGIAALAEALKEVQSGRGAALAAPVV